MSERLLQLIMNVNLHCLRWETELKNGKLSIISLQIHAAELRELLAFITGLLERIEASGSDQSISWLFDDVDIQILHKPESRRLLRGIEEASFLPLAKLLVDFMLSGKTCNDVHAELFEIAGGSLMLKQLPSHLRGLAGRILDCGSSARILRTLEHRVENRLSPRLRELVANPLCLMDTTLSGVLVGEVYESINGMLLEFVVQNGFEKELSMRHEYCLLARSEWVNEFLVAGGIEELEKASKNASIPRLSSLTRRFTHNEYSAMLQTFNLDDLNSDQRSEDDTMLGVKAFTLDRTKSLGALSIVFTEGIVQKYQMIFRHLFYAKYIEVKLNGIWSEIHELGRKLDTENRLFLCYELSHRMTHFINNYLFYLFVDVLQSKDWSGVTTQGSVFLIRDYLDSLLSEIVNEFHFNSSIFKSIHRVLSTCSLFCTHMLRFLHMNVATSTEASVEERRDNLAILTDQEKYTGMISKFQEAFDSQIDNLMTQLKSANRSNKSAHNLIGRLDFNNFFSDRMGI